ncbi:MAG: hypothetical protein IH820_01845 [Bacteroidetes bacterium]|nr:hypothetical protein [Bacteroidota bacterium]
MFDHRLFLKHVLVSLLLGSLFGVAPGAAQDTPTESVPLRLVHGGDFLPRGTAIVVLADQGEIEPGASLQPRFLAPDAYPLQRASVVRHDTLDARGAARARYPTTKSTGTRYFIYARTPEETVYWSYSAQKDSIKYDTIDRGVMAVAPIRDRAAREQVVQTFFEPSVAPAHAEADTVALPATAPQQTTPLDATPPAPQSADILIPSWVFFLLVPFVLACIAGLLFLTLHYRTRLPTTDPPRFNAADWHPDRRVGLEQELAEIKTNYERLQKTYNVLLDRHKTLIRKVQQLQQGTTRAPQETPTQRVPQDPRKTNP